MVQGDPTERPKKRRISSGTRAFVGDDGGGGDRRGDAAGRHHLAHAAHSRRSPQTGKSDPERLRHLAPHRKSAANPRRPLLPTAAPVATCADGRFIRRAVTATARCVVTVESFPGGFASALVVAQGEGQSCWYDQEG